MNDFVPVGRFFSMGNGRVGQYLSIRVLNVRTPFRQFSRSNDVSYLGFEKLNQAQKFAQSLAGAGQRFSVQKSQVLVQFPFEIKLVGNSELAKSLAYWDRKDQNRFAIAPQKQSIAA